MSPPTFAATSRGRSAESRSHRSPCSRDADHCRNVTAVRRRPSCPGIVPTVPMGTAADYSVLAATTVTNTNMSVLG